MKLQLQHLAPYLPYGLKLNQYEEDVDRNTHSDMLGLGSNDTVKISIKRFPGIETVYFKDIKPILRPLSDLDKEINHKGLQIKPLEIIGQDYIQDGFLDDDGLGFGWGQSTGGGDEQDYWLTIENEKHLKMVVWCGNKQDNGYVVEEYFMPYMYFNMFLEWHFDVFGLIPNGLAVDINTL